MPFKSLFHQIKLWLGLIALVWVAVLTCVLLSMYINAERQLKRATKNLRDLGHQYIDYSLLIEDSIPLNTFINIKGLSPIGLKMNLTDSIPIAMAVNFKDSFQLPIDIRINDMITIDTVVTFPNPFFININSTIPVEQKMQLVSLGGINVKVKAELPLNQLVKAEIKDPVHIVSAVPVQMHVAQDIPVKLDLQIPIKNKIRISLPIKQNALVSFPNALPISGFVPIRLKVKVSIPIAETPIKKYLDSTADNLDRLLRSPLSFH
jgi:hypothetical protein